MFGALEELAEAVRTHAPRVLDELGRVAESIVSGAESLARIADAAEENRRRAFPDAHPLASLQVTERERRDA